MARSSDDYLWALARAERTALARDLSDLNAEQWQHNTLCGEWDVEEVVAHLTAAASLNQWRWALSMLGARSVSTSTTSVGWSNIRAAPPPRRSTDSAPSSAVPPPPRDTPLPTLARSSCTRKISVNRWDCPGRPTSTR